jgi:hypothetical protein
MSKPTGFSTNGIFRIESPRIRNLILKMLVQDHVSVGVPQLMGERRPPG